MQRVISALLIIVAFIHLVPAAGVLDAEVLTRMYGLPFEENNIQILMRHRAVLFGLLTVFLLWAAFSPRLQPAALMAGLVSVLSFVWLAWTVGGHNALLQRVFAIDLAALVCLLAGIALQIRCVILARKTAIKEKENP